MMSSHRITTRSHSSRQNNNNNNNNNNRDDDLLPRLQPRSGDDDGQFDNSAAVAAASRNNDGEQQHGNHDDGLPSSTDGGNEPSRWSARLEKRGTVEYFTNNDDDESDESDEEEDDESNFEVGGGTRGRGRGADGTNNKKKNESDTEAEEEGGEDDYGSQTVANLRQLCKERGLKQGGKKEELVDRLTGYDNGEDDEEPNRATTRSRATNGTNNKKKNFVASLDQTMERLLYLHGKGMHLRENDTQRNWDEVYLHLYELEMEESYEGMPPSFQKNKYRTWFYQTIRIDWDDRRPGSRGNGPINPRPPYDIGQFNPTGKMTVDDARKEVEAFALYMEVETGVKKAVLPTLPGHGKYSKKFFQEGGRLAEVARMVGSMKSCLNNRAVKSTAIYEKALAILEEAGLVLKNSNELDAYYQSLGGNMLMGKFRQSSNHGSNASFYLVNLFNYCEIELLDDMELAAVDSVVKRVLQNVRADEKFALTRCVGDDEGDFFNNKILPLLPIIDKYITEHHSNPDYARIRGELTKKKPCSYCDDLGRPHDDWHRLPCVTDGQHDGTRESDGRSSQWIKANEDGGIHPSSTSGERLEELVREDLLVSRCSTHHRNDDQTRTERFIGGEDVEIPEFFSTHPKALLMVTIYLEVKKQLTGNKCAWTKEKFDYLSCLDGHHVVHQSEDESGGGYKPLRITYNGKERVFHLAKTIKEGLWKAVMNCKTIDELVQLLLTELPLILFIEACAHRAYHFLIGPKRIQGLSNYLSSQGHDIMADYFITEEPDSFVIDANEHTQYRRFVESEEVTTEETSNDDANNTDNNMDVDDDKDSPEFDVEDDKATSTEMIGGVDQNVLANSQLAVGYRKFGKCPLAPIKDGVRQQQYYYDDDYGALDGQNLFGHIHSATEDFGDMNVEEGEEYEAYRHLHLSLKESDEQYVELERKVDSMLTAKEREHNLAIESMESKLSAIIAANEEEKTMLLATIDERDAAIASYEEALDRRDATIDGQNAIIAANEEEKTKLLATIDDLSSLTKQMEKLTCESKEKDEKIAVMQVKHESDVVRLTEAHAAAIATKDEEMAVAISTKNEEMAALEADHAAAIATKDEEMTGLRDDCADRVAALEAARAFAISAKDEEMASMVIERNQTIESMQVERNTHVARLEATHRGKMEEMDREHNQIIESMKAAHAREITAYANRVAASHAAHARELSTKNEEMAVLEAAHAVEIATKDEEMAAAIATKNEEMAALETAISAKDEEMTDLRKEMADMQIDLVNACNYYHYHRQMTNNMQHQIDELMEEAEHNANILEENDECIIDYEEEVEYLQERVECLEAELQAELQDTKAALSEYESSTVVQVVSGIVFNSRKRHRVSVNNDDN